MAVNIEVKAGSVATVNGPAKISVTSDVPGSVLIDGEPVGTPAPSVPPPEQPAPPTLASLNPATAVCGDAADVTLTVNGEGFTDTSVIRFNGYDEPTTFVSENSLTTIVKPSLFTVPADVPCAVRNADQLSNELAFSFTAAAARVGKRS
jgi:hypothetical protein